MLAGIPANLWNFLTIKKNVMNTYIRVNGKVRYFKNEKEASAFLKKNAENAGKKAPESGGKKKQEDK